jgi:hypothetical protein
VPGAAAVLGFLLLFAVFPDSRIGWAVILLLAGASVIIALSQRRKSRRPMLSASMMDASGLAVPAAEPCAHRVYRGWSLRRKMLAPAFLGLSVGLLLAGLSRASGADLRFALVIGLGVFAVLAGNAVLDSKHELHIDQGGFLVSRRLSAKRVPWSSVKAVTSFWRSPNLVTRSPMVNAVMSGAVSAGNFRWLVILVSLDRRTIPYQSGLRKGLRGLLGTQWVEDPGEIEIDTSEYGEDVADDLLRNLESCWEASKAPS